MSRDRYYEIRRNLGIGTFQYLDSKVKHQDPLWSTRPLMDF